MFKYLSYFIFFFLAVLQTAIVPLNLSLGFLAILLAIGNSVLVGLSLAFVAGLFLDLAAGNFLGSSSILFLIFTIIYYLYRRRFNYQNPIFMALYIFVTALIYNRLIFGFIYWERSLILGLIIGLVVFVLAGSVVLSEKRGTGIKLKL